MNDYINQVAGMLSGVYETLMALFSFIANLFIKNPLYFLGGLVLLRVSQKGVKLKLSDLLDFKL